MNLRRFKKIIALGLLGTGLLVPNAAVAEEEVLDMVCIWVLGPGEPYLDCLILPEPPPVIA